MRRVQTAKLLGRLRSSPESPGVTLSGCVASSWAVAGSSMLSAMVGLCRADLGRPPIDLPLKPHVAPPRPPSPAPCGGRSRPWASTAWTASSSGCSPTPTRHLCDSAGCPTRRLPPTATSWTLPGPPSGHDSRSGASRARARVWLGVGPRTQCSRNHPSGSSVQRCRGTHTHQIWTDVGQS